MQKFSIGSRVAAERKGQGTIIEVDAEARPGFQTKYRYRVEWDKGPRTWFRESALTLVRR